MILTERLFSVALGKKLAILEPLFRVVPSEFGARV